MATLLLGNSSPLLDFTFPRRRRLLLPPPDSAASTSRHYLGIRPLCLPRRGKPICRAAAEDPDGDGEGEVNNLESEMSTRLRELEDMRELERRAAELQSRIKEETEEEKRERVRKELEKLAKEQAERAETAKLMFDLGQKAYGRGMYGRSVEFLEGALTIIPRPTLLGGEVQIWLAMAYEADNRHRDCITLYEELEKRHPSISIRRQAAELRYILEAPKLKISKDEMVSIPLIGSSYDNYAATWSDKQKDEDRRKKPVTGISSSEEDYWGDFLPWRSPSGWEKNGLFWVAATLLLGLLGVALLIQS